jgi:hypothetical protein
MASQTDWVSPAQSIVGRDHLAVQAVSEHIYSSLVPGITNVTERARCYSFYPWFVWAFDREVRKKSSDELILLFRRADCLHTLIGIAHELKAGEEWSHGGGLVGRETLLSVAHAVGAGKPIRLSEYASLDAPPGKRYFKNKLGGLGQYYLGPMKALEVLDGDARTGLKYTAEWGATLAEAYDEKVDRKEFFRVVQHDEIDSETLRSLDSFCPCNLRKNSPERDALVDLIFRLGKGNLKQERGLERRNTLLLLLDYVRRFNFGSLPDVQGFLASAYSNFLPTGALWDIPDILKDTTTKWSIYQRHELLGIAVQGLFWGGLRALDEEGGFLPGAYSYGKWFGRRFELVTAHLGDQTSVASLIQARRAAQPPHSSWQSEDHELTVANALIEAQTAGKTDLVVELAVQLIVALLARADLEEAYSGFDITPQFLDTYEINLVSLQRYASGAWSQMNALEWLEWLASIWALKVHFRVAFRKLRYQTQDSFRIVPLEEGLRVREAPVARWSSPRLDQALRFLYDLGMLDRQKDVEATPYVLNAFGKDFLEHELGQH